MSSQSLFLAALIAPIFIMAFGVPFARKIGLRPFTIFATLVCWILIITTVSVVWDEAANDAVARHASGAELQKVTADGGSMVFTLLFGWLPALIYCAFCLR